MNQTTITLTGNLADDPTLRFTPSGAVVANFRILSTPRKFDKARNEWVDGETLGINCTVWREQAETVTESLHRGTRVIATGELVSRSWDDKETGQKRTVMEMQIDEIGPSLKNASAKVTKAERGRPAQQPQGDPWATQPAQTQGAPSYGEPAF